MTDLDGLSDRVYRAVDRVARRTATECQPLVDGAEWATLYAVFVGHYLDLAARAPGPLFGLFGAADLTDPDVRAAVLRLVRRRFARELGRIGKDVFGP